MTEKHETHVSAKEAEDYKNAAQDLAATEKRALEAKRAETEAPYKERIEVIESKFKTEKDNRFAPGREAYKRAEGELELAKAEYARQGQIIEQIREEMRRIGNLWGERAKRFEKENGIIVESVRKEMADSTREIQEAEAKLRQLERSAQEVYSITAIREYGQAFRDGDQGKIDEAQQRIREILSEYVHAEDKRTQIVFDFLSAWAKGYCYPDASQVAIEEYTGTHDRMPVDQVLEGLLSGCFEAVFAKDGRTHCIYCDKLLGHIKYLAELQDTRT